MSVPIVSFLASVLCAFPPAADQASTPPPAESPVASPVTTAGRSPSPAAAAPAAPPVSAPQPRTAGFAFELGTGGLSGTVGGALGLGYGSRKLSGGLAIDLAHASLDENQYGNTDHLSTTALSVGPWLRFEMGRTLDGRVDFMGAIDFQYSRQSTSLGLDTNPNTMEGTATGIIFRIGPGIRFWATDWLALSYTTQVLYTSLSGPLLAFSPSSTLGPLNYNFDNTQFALVGRIAALAIF